MHERRNAPVLPHILQMYEDRFILGPILPYHIAALLHLKALLEYNSCLQQSSRLLSPSLQILIRNHAEIAELHREERFACDLSDLQLLADLLVSNWSEGSIGSAASFDVCHTNRP